MILFNCMLHKCLRKLNLAFHSICKKSTFHHFYRIVPHFSNKANKRHLLNSHQHGILNQTFSFLQNVTSKSNPHFYAIFHFAVKLSLETNDWKIERKANFHHKKEPLRRWQERLNFKRNSNLNIFIINSKAPSSNNLPQFFIFPH